MGVAESGWEIQQWEGGKKERRVRARARERAREREREMESINKTIGKNGGWRSLMRNFDRNSQIGDNIERKKEDWDTDGIEKKDEK